MKYDPSGYYKTLGIRIAKGGPGSGSWEAPGQPRFARDAGEAGKNQEGKFDRAKYAADGAKERMATLQRVAGQYRELYVRKTDQEGEKVGLSPKARQSWDVMNARVGRYEGIRRALLSKGESLKGKEGRKYMMMAISMQKRIIQAANYRDNKIQ